MAVSTVGEERVRDGLVGGRDATVYDLGDLQQEQQFK